MRKRILCNLSSIVLWAWGFTSWDLPHWDWANGVPWNLWSLMVMLSPILNAVLFPSWDVLSGLPWYFVSSKLFHWSLKRKTTQHPIFPKHTSYQIGKVDGDLMYQILVIWSQADLSSAIGKHNLLSSDNSMIYYIISVAGFLEIEMIFTHFHLFSFCLVFLHRYLQPVVWLLFLKIFFPPFKNSLLFVWF